MKRRQGPTDQLDLFAPPRSEAVVEAASGSRAAPLPAHVPAEISALAARLPAEVRLGTSSWSFPGWAGLVYDREHTAARLARAGLAAYGAHPLLRTVGIDRTYYAPVAAEVFAEYAAAVGADFRFVVKAHELCTLARFPRQPRYGGQQGARNDLFLDAAYARDLVVAPFVEGLGAHAGVLVFQFPPQSPREIGGRQAFAARLHDFLSALPAGPTYAVEIRNAELLTREYAAAIAAAGARHCVNVHPTMPPVEVQAELAGALAADALLVRWMLGGGQGYDEARERYRPFDRLVDPDPDARRQIARLCIAFARRGRPASVVVNNKAEGSAPRSVIELARQISAGLP